MSNYKQPAAYNKGTGLSWKYGPPRAAQAGQIRQGLGNYMMPLPRPGSPEPLGCSGGGGGGCGCSSCGPHEGHGEIVEGIVHATVGVAMCGLLALGAGVAIKSIIGMFKKPG